MKIILAMAVLGLGLTAVPVMAIADDAADIAAPKASAEILGADGAVIGTASFHQGPIGVLADIRVSNLPPGRHGMHFHAKGTCDHHEHFKTATGHINDDGKAHGYLNPEGPEKGDLPNIIVHADGTAAVELFLPQLNVSGEGASLLDEDGSALMIHANPDDHLTQPIGGAGPRIACGVVSGR